MSTVTSREAFVGWLTHRPDCWLIGIAGVPGAGKSTLAGELAARFPGSVVVPMDGYHLPRRMLDEEGLRRRGAAPTFDSAAFRSDLSDLRRNRSGIFPGWNHAAKDPDPGRIRIAAGVSRVFVEGNYLLLKSWELRALFDATLFLGCPIDVAMGRVETRLVECGIVADPAMARAQVGANDRLNAETILADGCRDRADFVIDP